MADKYSFQNILLIDDSEIDVLVNRRLMQLTSFSENVTIMHTAEDALDYLRNECTSAKYAPDWIFLDIYLPGITGFDFIEEFKKLPAHITEKTKVIVLSVIMKPDLWQKVSENNFVYGNLEKPLTREALQKLASTKYESVRIFES